MTYFLVALLAIVIVMLAYLVRASRTIGTKLTAIKSAEIKQLQEIKSLSVENKQRIKKVKAIINSSASYKKWWFARFRRFFNKSWCTIFNARTCT